MSSGKRYDETKLNYKKVFAVLMAIIVFAVSIIVIKNIVYKAKNTKPLEMINYYALYQDEKWGILGTNGKTIIEPMYQEMPVIIDNSKDVFLCTYDINEENGTYKTKVINSKNEEIWTNYDKIESLENYDEAGNIWYEENTLKVSKDGKWGLIDLDGNEISAIEYDEISTIKGIENSLIIKKDGQLGLLNNKGKRIIDSKYKEIKKFGEDYKNGYITIDQENKYGLVSVSGETILKNQYEKIEDIYSDKYFVIKEGERQQLIDKEGNKVLTEDYNEIKQIANSGIVFISENKYGFMDFEGKTTIQPIYENLKEINTNVFLAVKDGKSGIIDMEEN